MFKRLPILFIFALAAYVTLSDSLFKLVAFGIAMFLVGMIFMEDGFKQFAGGALQRVLKRTTSTMPKALFSGFAATAIVQSSSLVSVIAISFLSSKLMTLASAMGVIFGANLGTTATTWIVSLFGVKIKIATYAMPMVIFGVIFKFFKEAKYQGVGNVLIGLGFIFLGIDYMKEGFDTIKDTIDLTQFSGEGLLGLLLYIAIGIAVTVIVQSSSATMALVVTALATGQIVYYDALAISIGANVGTTVTAIVGSLAASSDGKRLAVAHLVFNLATALLAVVFLPLLAASVDFISAQAGIEELVLKLAIFHTIFNLLGIAVVTPFYKVLANYLQRLFIPKGVKVKYLDENILEVAEASLEAIRNETQRLYKLSKKEMLKVLNNIDISLDERYRSKIKELHANIVLFSLKAQKNMDETQARELNAYKMASIHIIEALKSLKHMQKNFKKYLHDDNVYVSREYQKIRESLMELFDEIKKIRKSDSEVEKLVHLEVVKEKAKEFDLSSNREFEELVQDRRIDPMIATSIINDNAYAHRFINRLANMAEALFISDQALKELHEDEDNETG